MHKCRGTKHVCVNERNNECTFARKSYTIRRSHLRLHEFPENKTKERRRFPELRRSKLERRFDSDVVNWEEVRGYMGGAAIAMVIRILVL